MFNVYNRYTDTAGNLRFTDCYEKQGREHTIRADGGAVMGELIDREAVREFIKSYSHSTDVVYHMEKHLYEVPTIDAVPVRHGEWIHLYKNNYRCSVCGAWFIFEDENNPYEEGRFCPYCGARMDGGKDDRS